MFESNLTDVRSTTDKSPSAVAKKNQDISQNKIMSFISD